MPQSPEKFDQTCGYKAKRALYAINGVIQGRLAWPHLDVVAVMANDGADYTVTSGTGPLGRLRICHLVLSIAYLDKAAD